MMNKNKIILFATSIIIIIAIILGGGYMLHESKRQHYIDIQKKRIELFFKENINNYQSIKVTDIGKTPLGSYTIKGYINNNKKLDFLATLSSDNNYQFEDTISYPQEVGNMYKPPRSHKKFPSQIIKDKNLNENEYTADPPLIWGF
ncbi:DUF1433 domain-containing protein [Staphylococcus epidermidis]|uniref:DUF1433 domain-containing protein n=1 Tax=Staphylococcus epidermidis TaxID=1282 RepID=UPI0036D2FD3C|nr:DUF1433 domain-containing protein [Staphylococcus epidermidis]MCG1730306.1 DUF1433 domain-containing protein [Staphylococcus epidermidis]